MRLDPTNNAALRELGSVLLARGEYEPARRFFVRAIQADRTDRASMGWLDCTFQRLGNAPQAEV